MNNSSNNYNAGYAIKCNPHTTCSVYVFGLSFAFTCLARMDGGVSTSLDTRRRVKAGDAASAGA